MSEEAIAAQNGAADDKGTELQDEKAWGLKIHQV